MIIIMKTRSVDKLQKFTQKNKSCYKCMMKTFGNMVGFRIDK